MSDNLLSALDRSNSINKGLLGFSGSDSIDMIQKYYNQPLMIDDDTAEYIGTQAGVRMRRVESNDDPKAYGYGELSGGRHRLYKVEDGVAILNVKGILEHDSYWYGSYWTGYDAIQSRFDMAREDPEVNGIAWFFNTNGGEVAGNFDLADYIYRHRDDKPMIAIVNEKAYSAGYSLASSVGNIHVGRTAGVGSIGVVTVHMDHSKWLKDIGIKPTLFFAGKHKVDGNPYEPIPETVQKTIQERIDGLYTIFVDTVARNRNMKSDAVRATEAATFSGEEAVSVGLADVVMGANDALAAFKNELNGSSIVGDNLMSDNQTNGAVTDKEKASQQATVTAEQLESAEATAKASGAAEESARIMGILESDEAKGRSAAAMVLAKNPAMSKDEAVKLLTALPVETAETTDDLSNLMNNLGGGPNLETSEQNANTEKVVAIDSASIYDSMNGGASQ